MPYDGGNSILGWISTRHCYRLPYHKNSKIKHPCCCPRVLLHDINSLVLLFSSCLFLHYLPLIGCQPCIPTIKLQFISSAAIVNLLLQLCPLFCPWGLFSWLPRLLLQMALLCLPHLNWFATTTCLGLSQQRWFTHSCVLAQLYTLHFI